MASSPSLSLPDSFDLDLDFDESLLLKERPKQFPQINRKLRTNKYNEYVLSLEKALEQSKLELESSRQTINNQNQTIDKLRQSDKLLRENSEQIQRLLNQSERDQAYVNVEINRDQINDHSKTVDSLKSINTSLSSTVSECQQLSNLLEKDKAYLTVEIDRLKSQLTDSNMQLSSYQSKCNDLENKLSALSNQLLSLQLSAGNTVNERVETEVNKIREESRRELVAMKQLSRSVNETQIRTLQDNLSSALSDKDKLDVKLRELSSVLEEVQSERSQERIANANESAELRADIKLKSFECSELKLKLTEWISLNKQYQLENDMNREELLVHKQAITRIEAESQQKEFTLRSELEAVKRKVQIYEVLEHEIDEAVHNAGLSKDAKRPEDLVNSLRHLATDPERRVRQAVFLAQRVIQLERQRDELIDRIDKLQCDLIEGQSKIKSLEEDLQRVSQPVSYLVNKLREEEATKAVWIERHESLSALYLQLQDKSDKLQNDNDNLSNKLVSLLKQREDVMSLKELVEAWQYQQELSDSDNDDNESIINKQEFEVNQSQSMQMSEFDLRKSLGSHRDQCHSKHLEKRPNKPSSLKKADKQKTGKKANSKNANESTSTSTSALPGKLRDQLQQLLKYNFYLTKYCSIYTHVPLSISSTL
eukprot:gene20538-26638_t